MQAFKKKICINKLIILLLRRFFELTPYIFSEYEQKFSNSRVPGKS